MLGAIADILRDKSSDEDVFWVDSKLVSSLQINETSKWFKVLQQIGHEGNQQAYIKILNNLPNKTISSRRSRDDIDFARAGIVGHVLGGISSEKSVRALLALADDDNQLKQYAVESAIGYVQEVSAIPAIDEVINSSKANHRQIVLATEMLGYIASKDSADRLQKLTKNLDEEISQAAKEALHLLMQNNPEMKIKTDDL
jgi:HEAT repeat protein